MVGIRLDRRPIVPHPCLRYADGDAVLLAREVRFRALALPASAPRRRRRTDETGSVGANP
jgi:hypothetical protein